MEKTTLLQKRSAVFACLFLITFAGLTPTVKAANNEKIRKNYRSSYANPDINIIGNYRSITNGDSTTSESDQTNFGSVSIGSGTVTVTYTIENTGAATLSIGAITFSGANAADFTLLASPATTLAAGNATTFQVGFNPTLLGVKNAEVSITSNDPDENPYAFAITGFGVQTYNDTDGDGITDNLDIDDDNDGILDTIEQTSCLHSPFASSVEYVFLNETFGTGTTKGQININIPGATCTYCYEDGIVGTNTAACPFQSTKILDDGEYCVNYKITGTTAADPENIHGDLAWYDGADHTPGDTNGRMAIFNASFAAGTFYETTITGVIPYVPITYSFWALNIMSQATYPSSILPNITVEFTDLDDNVLSTFNTGDLGRCGGSTADNSCATGSWRQFSTMVNLGNVTEFIIRFKNNAHGGAGNDLALDDISIVQQYCDSDGDGVANLFDLDDENDGIPDIEEAGFKAYSNGSATMGLASAATWTDANGNGLHDDLDAMILGGNYLIADTDGDNVPDYLDLDSDNDSFFDVDEAGIFNGDGDINGDGKGDLADTDRDGILDLYDNHVGFGTTARAYAQNTDGLGIPDYRQTDSDNDGINDINAGLFANLDSDDDGIIDDNTDNDKDGLPDVFDTNDTSIGSPRDLNTKLYLQFDGRNDYAQADPVVGGLASASIMAWIDLNNAFSGDGVVFGQDKFQLRINSSKKLEASVNNTSVAFNTTALYTSRWYHVGAVYGNGFLKLYLNGVMVASTAATGTIDDDASPLTIGKDPANNSKYFNGKVDELRLFDVALSDEQFQRMVYQEIEEDAAEVRGAIIPKNIGALPYANLLRYYRMDAYKDDIVDDLTAPGIDSGSGMRIFNNKIIQVQQAPMPFVTERTGNFATAVNSTDKDIHGMDIMDQDWSIVQVDHDITETSNNTDLGMFVDTDATITMDNDTKIQNDWYLKLDGKIKLQHKSQLVQTSESDLDVASAGLIEKDQQGQTNKFNYNYWSSPVGDLSTTTNNNSFTVSSVMFDATDEANPLGMNWTTGYNSTAAVPITLSAYWIFKFQNLSPEYSNWTYAGPNGNLLPAQGFTLKGSSAEGLTQNYAFIGKPNNGAISSPIAANNANLSGNPYASALDANAFISANSTSTTGVLYFWEHFPTNSTHVLADYQGGYATRSLVGGAPPVAPAGISGLGSSTRIPGRYIPVGQGFLLYGSAVGGTIKFDNSQRKFIKEDNSNSNALFRNLPAANAIVGNNNPDPTTEDENFATIRLGFNSNGFHRQLLLGFMNELATNGYDYGYDAVQIDNQPNDVYFVLPDHTRLVIQGVGAFTTDGIYPLEVKTASAGTVNFTLDATENFTQAQEIFIYDNLDGQYHNIRNGAYSAEVAAGVTSDRFSLRFHIPSLLANAGFEPAAIDIRFTNQNNMLTIENGTRDSKVISVTLYNILGQIIDSWNVENKDQKRINIPVKNGSAGTYIAQILTTKGTISKKIVIR